MAFVRVGGPRKFIKYAQCTKGQVLIDGGTFVGTEEGKFGIEFIFENPDGTATVLNKAQHLIYLVDKHLTPGTVCNVIYDGMKTMPETSKMAGKDAHTFIIEVDPTTRNKPVAAVKAKPATADVSDITL